MTLQDHLDIATGHVNEYSAKAAKYQHLADLWSERADALRKEINEMPLNPGEIVQVKVTGEIVSYDGTLYEVRVTDPDSYYYAYAKPTDVERIAKEGDRP